MKRVPVRNSVYYYEQCSVHVRTNSIRPASANSQGTDLSDTFQFLEQINGVQLDQYTMVSYDVRSLFTNVPLKERIDTNYKLIRVYVIVAYHFYQKYIYIMITLNMFF